DGTTGSLGVFVPDPTPDLELGEDYVILAGVLADAAGRIVITHGANPAHTNGTAPFNGLQLIGPFAAVPEPSTWVMACLGAVGVAARSPSRSRARPKSLILAAPSAVRRMLAGLRSRWTMPWVCAWWMARARVSTRAAARAGGQGTPSSRRSRLPPSTRSTAR